VFIADDGVWHLFYATDFLDHTHIGTGTMRDRLLDPFTPAGQPTPVTRPRYDWHVYDPRRAEKGGVRWHTIEGSFVIERKGRFYQMFSGGNWQNPTYGVSYAVADAIDQAGEWEQVCDGDRVLPILRTIPGEVIGPGHNSAVRGPDNVQPYCVYHRWRPDGSARVLAIDPLDWAGERMLVLGPSSAPRPAPNPPTFADFFDEERAEGLGAGWECQGGRWSARDGAAVQGSAAGAAMARRAATASFVAEVSARALDTPAGGAYGLSCGGRLFALLAPAQRQLVVRTVSRDTGPAHARIPLPDGFDAGAYHLLRVEVNAGRAIVSLDGNARRWLTRLPADGPIDSVALVTERAAAAFSGFALTSGWQDLFAERGANPADLGWRIAGGAWRVQDAQLQCEPAGAGATLVKGALPDAYELVVNARLLDAAEAGSYGIYPCAQAGDLGPLLGVERDSAAGGWSLVWRDGDATRLFALPGFDPLAFQQFRFRKQGGALVIHWEARALGRIPAPAAGGLVGLHARGTAAAFDMVRVTAIPS
jgi:hypothetical protein